MTTTTMSTTVEQAFRTNARKVLIDNMLAESSGLTTLSVLEEAAGGSSALIVEGKVGQCGTATANKRLYERHIMDREIKRLQEKIENRAALAAVDHPGDGKSRIREAGAICLGLRVESDGSIFGKYEIVEDSTGGKDLAAFLRRGCAIGMSSRGIGSTRVDATGNHVVGEDFRLHGFDFVADPACRDAFPKLVSEDIDPDTVSENEIRVRFPQLVEGIEDRARQAGAETVAEDVREEIEKKFTEQVIPAAREELREDIRLEVLAEVRESLRDDFTAQLLKSLQSVKDEAIEIAKSELLSDPSVAGAKRFMEDLAQKLVPYRADPDLKALMDEREAEVAELEESLQQAVQTASEVRSQAQAQVEETERKARSLGFRLYVERALSGQPSPDQVRNIVGDPDKYSTVEELTDAVRVAIEQVQESAQVAEERASVATKVQEHKAELASAKAQQLDRQLDEVRREFSNKIETVAERFERQLSEKDSLLAEAADTITRLEQTARSAQTRASDADLLSYTTRRTVVHPRERDIMAAVQSGRVNSKEGVRELAEQWDYRGDEPGGAAERIRRSLGRGKEAPTENDRAASRSLTEDNRSIPGLEDFGSTMGEIKRLAGVGQRNTGRRRF